MRTYFLIIFSLSCVFVSPDFVAADKLCIKKVQKVKNGRVKLRNVLRTETACPNRFVEILDTDTFKGEAGDPGQDAVTNLEVEVSSNVGSVVSNGLTTMHESGCSAGKTLISGGCHINQGGANLTENYLNSSNGLWRCKYENTSGGNLTLQVTVLANCVDTP